MGYNYKLNNNLYYDCPGEQDFYDILEDATVSGITWGEGKISGTVFENCKLPGGSLTNRFFKKTTSKNVFQRTIPTGILLSSNGKQSQAAVVQGTSPRLYRQGSSSYGGNLCRYYTYRTTGLYQIQRNQDKLIITLPGGTTKELGMSDFNLPSNYKHLPYCFQIVLQGAGGGGAGGKGDSSGGGGGSGAMAVVVIDFYHFAKNNVNATFYVSVGSGGDGGVGASGSNNPGGNGGNTTVYVYDSAGTKHYITAGGGWGSTSSSGGLGGSVSGAGSSLYDDAYYGLYLIHSKNGLAGGAKNTSGGNFAKQEWQTVIMRNGTTAEYSYTNAHTGATDKLGGPGAASAFSNGKTGGSSSNGSNGSDGSGGGGGAYAWFDGYSGGYGGNGLFVISY